MTPRPRRRRPGFTLIELLVVMAIIAIGAALLLPAVQRSRVRGKQVENYDRMKKIATTLAGLKDPHNGLNLDYVPAGGFTLKGRYNGNEPELFILKKAWPNMNTVANPDRNGDTSNGYTGPDVVLDSNQTLTFFLTGGEVTQHNGFSLNPRAPFETTTLSRKGPFLDIRGNIKNLSMVAPNGQAWLIDPFGTPYGYFTSRDARGSSGAYANQSFTAPGAGTTRPWMNSGKFVNEFQITSAGKDKVFGSGGALPGLGNPGGDDDQADFTTGVLGAGL